MNICLINPPSPFLINEKVFPNLGILKIATYLQNNNYNIQILDLKTNFQNDEIYKFLITHQIDVVGITAVSPQIPIVLNIAQYIKKCLPSIKLILGGPHITMSHNSIKTSNRVKESYDKLIELFDTTIIGYGELAIISALSSNIKIIDTETNPNMRLTKEIYQTLSHANRDFLDIKSYQYQIENVSATSIISQLGCPYKCSFCGGRFSQTYGNTLSRTPESIISELDMLVQKYNYRGFMFYDDEINLNKKVFLNTLDELIKYQEKNNLNLYFRGFSRSDIFDEEEAKLMYRAGFRWILFGFESGCNKILNNMNKHTTVEQNTQAIRIARKHNLKIKALMSIGHPGESIQTIDETNNWLKHVQPDEKDISIITLYPGTSYFDKSTYDGNKWIYEINHDILYSTNISFLQDKTYYKSKENEYSCYVSTEHLTSVDIIKHRDILAK